MVTFFVEEACLYLFCTFGESGICIRNKLLLVFVFLLDIMICFWPLIFLFLVAAFWRQV